MKDKMWPIPARPDLRIEGLAIYYEEGTRVAACRKCRKPIPKKTPRVRLAVPLTFQKDFGKGRKTRRINAYLHPECLSGTAKGHDPETCFECGVSFLPAAFGRWAYTGTKYPAVKLCGTCSSSARWRPCHYCTMYLPRWKVSKVLDSDLFACDFCVDESNIKTERKIRELERRFAGLRRVLQRKGPYT